MTERQRDQRSDSSHDEIGENLALSTIMVGIPCYNEEVAIGSMVLRSLAYADRVVVLDDGSTDNTAEVAHLAGAEVLVHELNMGKGAALRDLFAYATRTNVDIVVIIDGDGQHDPSDIPHVVQPLLLDEADIVNGSRYLHEATQDTPRYRRFGQRVLDMVTRLGLDDRYPITDTQSGFRAFAIKTAPYFKFDADRLAIDSEMLMDAAKAQLRIAEVPVRVRYDVGRSSAHPVSHGVEVLRGVLRNVEYERPLLIFTAPGVGLLVGGSALAAWILSVYYRIGRVVYGPTMLASLLIVVGVFLALTGVILHSMSSLVRNRETR